VKPVLWCETHLSRGVVATASRLVCAVPMCEPCFNGVPVHPQETSGDNHWSSCAYAQAKRRSYYKHREEILAKARAYKKRKH